MLEAESPSPPTAVRKARVGFADALRRAPRALLTWPRLVVWYAVALFIGSTGSFLAYHPPITSDAWLGWSGGYPWAVDALRLVVAAILALFVVWALGMLDAHNEALRGQLLEGWLIALPFAILSAVCAITFLYLPRAFIEELADRHWTGRITFRSIYVPYFPYSLYTIALWFGLAAPPLQCVLVRVRTDFSQWHVYRRELDESFAAVIANPATEERIVAVEIAFQNYVVRLKQVGERTLPVILAVAAMLVYEQATPSHEKALAATRSLMKVMVWALMGPAVLSFTIIVTLGYQSAVREAEHVYRRLLAESADRKVREKCVKLRDQLMWKGSGWSFALSILKSMSVLVLLIASGTAYVVKVANGNHWMRIFVPEPVVDLVKRVFAAH